MARGINRGRQRRAELQERIKVLAEERAARTPAQQLKVLDTRLGKGVGACKERAKLAGEIVAQAQKAVDKSKKKKKKKDDS
jgi:hypothetical protein